MNYYEELGIRPDASVEEIRQAFRLMARILHPDGQTDPALRRMAEIQMKRLNEIVSVLVSPQQRREYDVGLAPRPRPGDGSPRTPVRPRPAKRHRAKEWMHLALRYWFWALLAAVIAGSGVWYLVARDPGSAARFARLDIPPRQAAVPAEPGPAEPPAPRKAVPPPAARGTPEESPQDVVGRAVDPDPFRFSPAEDRPGTPAAPPRAPVIDNVFRPLPTVSAPAAPEAPTSSPLSREIPAKHPPPPAEQARFGGNWLYSPDRIEPSDSGLYPPWYAELVLLEEGGTLAGNYRALYRVPDKALSPQVLFRVEGKSTTGSSASVEWTSEDGARGQAELTLRSPNLMSVVWWTTQPGRRATVTAGTAQLIRQQVP